MVEVWTPPISDAAVKAATGRNWPEWRAELDDVGAIVAQGAECLEACFKIGIAGHDITHQRSAAFGANLVEPGGNS